MTAPDELDYDRAAHRIGRVMVVIAAIGTVAALVLGGWNGAPDFWWVRCFPPELPLAEKAGRKFGRQGPHGTVFLGFRYLLLGGGGYVILRYSPVSAPAVLTGLFVLIAAIFVELISRSCMHEVNFG